MPILTAQDIHKSYNSVHVLRGVSLTLEAGDVVSITGKSGAGKSTLLHILGTLDQADSGTVRLCDVDIARSGKAELNKLRNDKIGFIFQFHHLLDEFTALENVIMPALIRGQSKQTAAERGTELLAYLGLSHRLQHKPGELSGGEQQRTAVARALMNNPEIIFADEPTGNLDSENSEDLHKLFLKLREDFGQTFLIVTHNRQLATMSDRVMVMQDGLFVGNE